MKTSGFMVYWWHAHQAQCCRHFEMDEMRDALGLMEGLRKDPDVSYVTMVSENPDHTGKAGASTILPEDYAWSKQYRGDGEPRIKSLMGGRSNE